MTIWLYSGDRPSNGARELAKLPGFKRLRTGKGLKPNDFVVNWGTTQDIPILTQKIPNVPPVKLVFNWSSKVKMATNKLFAFEAMTAAGVQCVPWCLPMSTDVLKEWQAKECTIVGRTILTGHSGKGIIIMEPGSDIQPALLYTKYIFKVREFRVHVVGGSVVDTQQKIKDPNKTPLTWKVRSHENGFIFARNSIVPNDNRDALAAAACTALGLDFGAVDIIEDKKGNFYVLEVNTAPGLEGQTIKSYGDALSLLAKGDTDGLSQTQV